MNRQAQHHTRNKGGGIAEQIFVIFSVESHKRLPFAAAALLIAAARPFEKSAVFFGQLLETVFVQPGENVVDAGVFVGFLLATLAVQCILLFVLEMLDEHGFAILVFPLGGEPLLVVGI